MDASADLLKVNHRLESRVPEIGLLGSEGGATSSVVPTPITTKLAGFSKVLSSETICKLFMSFVVLELCEIWFS